MVGGGGAVVVVPVTAWPIVLVHSDLTAVATFIISPREEHEVTLVWATGYVSVGSMSGAVAFPLAVWLLQPGEPQVLAAGGLPAALIVVTPRANIRRLLEGREARFGHHATP